MPSEPYSTAAVSVRLSAGHGRVNVVTPEVNPVKRTPEDVVRPGDTVNGYRIERKLGAGGFGQVYLARQEGVACALKFIHPGSVGDWGWRELYILQRHEWPHVVRLLGHFKWPTARPEYLVLVMEYVPGPTLDEWARDTNPSARTVVELLLPLTRALRDLHAKGVFHRDLKGSNVLVRETEGAPVLVDFGAGTMRGVPRVTRHLAPASTRYRSPEAVAFALRADRAPGERYAYAVTDELYALGVLLHVLLTDRYPFDGSEEELLRDIVGRAPRSPCEHNSRVPPALGTLCLRLLAKEPSARFSSAEALCMALASLREEVRRDPRWDVPLCYGWAVEERTTEDDPERTGTSRPEWMRRMWRHQPRRGPRPEQAPVRLHWPRRVLAGVLTLSAVVAGVGHIHLRGHQDGDRSEPPLEVGLARSETNVDLAGPGALPRLVPNQKRPPCTAGLEREVNGGCWLATEHLPPKCPPQTVAYEGRCLVPLVKPAAVPVSVDEGKP